MAQGASDNSEQSNSAHQGNTDQLTSGARAETVLPHQDIIDRALATLRNSAAAGNITPFRTYVELTARIPWEDPYNYLLLLTQYPNASCLGTFKQWEREGAPIRQRQKAINLTSVSFQERIDPQGTVWAVPRYGTRRLFDTSQTTKPRRYQAPTIPFDQIVESVTNLAGRYGIAVPETTLKVKEIIQLLIYCGKQALDTVSPASASDFSVTSAHADLVGSMLARYCNLPYQMSTKELAGWSTDPHCFEEELLLCHHAVTHALCRLDPPQLT